MEELSFATALSMYRNSVHDISQIEEDYTDINHNVRVLEQTKKCFLLLKHNHILSNKEFIETTINGAIQSVFNINYRIEIEIIPPTKKKKSSTYKINYYQNDTLIADNIKIKHNDGGSILSYISFLFKIIINRIIGNDIVLLDEDLSQVSKNYLPAISNVIRGITEKYNMTIIVITHDKVLTEQAHTVYELGSVPQKKFSRLFVDEKVIDPSNDTNTEYQDCPEFRLEVTDFQTINKLDVLFKGFVCITGRGRTGKSAIFRSIKSVIYADYTQGYTRDGSRSGSEIKFTRTKTNCSVELSYNKKTNKITMATTSESGHKSTYVGINKSKDPILSFCSSDLGIYTPKLAQFKVNSDMKKSLSNIIIDSQFDSTMVVGASSNELDKLFETLFNTSAIVNALNDCELDLDKTLVEYSELKVSKKLKSDDILKYKELVKTLGAQNIMIIDQLTVVVPIDTKLSELQKELDLLNKQMNIIELNEDIVLIANATVLQLDLNDLVVNTNVKLQAKKQLIIDHEKELLLLDNKLLNLTKVNTITTGILQITDLINFLSKPKDMRLTEKLEIAKEEQSLFNIRYGIIKCNTCSGHGTVVTDKGQ